MPSQFPYLPKIYLYSHFSNPEQIWSVYSLYYGQVTYSYLFASSCFLNLSVPLLSLLFPHLIHQRLFAIPTKALLCSISETLFSVGHSRYECYYYSYPMKKSWKMGTFLENRILSLRKLGLVNVVYIERHNMV